jgi:hypothetical protein
MLIAARKLKKMNSSASLRGSTMDKNSRPPNSESCVVGDEKFTGAFRFGAEEGQPVGMRGLVKEVRRLDMPKGAVGFAKGVSDGGAQVQFDDLDGLGEEVAQSTVELVGLTNLLKRGAGEEVVARLLKRQTVPGESVVVEMAEKIGSSSVVSDLEAASPQLLKLARDGEPSFRIGTAHGVGTPGDASNLGKKETRP